MIWKNNNKNEIEEFTNNNEPNYDETNNGFGNLENNYGNDYNYNEENNNQISNQEIENNQTYQTAEPNYDEVGFKGFVKKTTRSKWFIPTISFLILLIIIILIFRGCESKTGTLKDISVNAPNIIYIGENTKISAKAKGSGNLKETNIRFSTSNTSIVELDTKRTLKGKKAEDTIIPISTGKFALYVDASLDKTKLETKEKEIVICKKLNETSFQTNNITIEKGQQSLLNIDLGTEKECFENIKYNPDNDNIEINENGIIKALKEGTTNLTVSDGKKNVTITINVINSNKKIDVKGIKLNKTTTTIELGSTEKLTATITPNNASNKTIKWTTDNEMIATVTNNGVIKGIGKGTTTIKATTEDNNHQAQITVKVTQKNNSNNNNSNNNNNSTTKPTTQTDKIAPKITELKMFSNNTNQNMATNNDIIFVTVKFNEAIYTLPQIEIAGKIVKASISSDRLTASGQIIVNSNMPRGIATLKVSNYKDKAGNTGNTLINVTTGSKVTIYDKDSSAPIATSVTMKSDNNNSTLAKEGNTITVTATFNEALKSAPTVKIAGNTATTKLSNDKKTVTATYKVTSSTTLGKVALSITGINDNAGNTGTKITNVTTGNKVTIYKLSNWSQYTTTKCTTGELCQSVSGYLKQTRTATKKYKCNNTNDSLSGTTCTKTTTSSKTISAYCADGGYSNDKVTISGTKLIYKEHLYTSDCPEDYRYSKYDCNNMGYTWPKSCYNRNNMTCTNVLSTYSDCATTTCSGTISNAYRDGKYAKATCTSTTKSTYTATTTYTYGNWNKGTATTSCTTDKSEPITTKCTSTTLYRTRTRITE